MRKHGLALGAAAALLALSGCVANARDDRRGDRRFDDRDQHVTRDWYNHHRDHPPEGLRHEDRLSADEESRFHEAPFSTGTSAERPTQRLRS